MNRNLRVGGIAVLDTALTAGAAFGIVYFAKKKSPNNFISGNLSQNLGWATFEMFIILVLISIPIHQLFKVRTKLGYKLGLNPDPQINQIQQK